MKKSTKLLLTHLPVSVEEYIKRILNFSNFFLYHPKRLCCGKKTDKK